MPQFLMGFWCGCVSATLVLCLLYANKKRQMEDVQKKNVEDEKNGSREKKRDSSVSGPQVLLVDDSRLSRTVIKEILTKNGLEVFEAGNGAECLKLAKKYQFDLFFIDQTMPGMSGDETLQRLIKENTIEPDVPVVAVGSAIRKENEKEFRKKGYAACLGKPIQENRLEEILSQVLPPKETIQKPEGFSYENGLNNFDGNEPVYRETLVLFADLWEERKEQLRVFLAEENMAEYAILIHAIKGDARTLGADILSRFAYEQEMKAKEGDAEAIRNSFEQVIGVGDKTAEYFKQMFS